MIIVKHHRVSPNQSAVLDGIELHPLVAAVWYNRSPELVRALVECGCDVNGLVAGKKVGIHPLMLAVQLERPEVVQELLVAAASSRQRVDQLWLDAACVKAGEGEHPRVVVLLLGCGAQVNALVEIVAQERFPVVSVQDGGKHSEAVLHNLCDNRHAISEKDKENRLTAVIYVVKDAKGDVNVRRPDGPTPLGVLRASPAYDRQIEGLLKDSGAVVMRSFKANMLLLMSIFVSLSTMVQLCAVPFSATSPFPRSYRPATSFFKFTLFDFDSVGLFSFRATAWLVSAVIGAFVVIGFAYRSRGVLKVFLPVIFPAGWLLCIVAYLPVMKTFFSVFDCNFQLDPPALDRSEDSIECFTKEHNLLMAASAVIAVPYTIVTVRLQRVDGLWHKLFLASHNPITRWTKLWSLDDYGGKAESLHPFSKNPVVLTRVGSVFVFLKLMVIAATLFLNTRPLILAYANVCIVTCFFLVSLLIPSYTTVWVNALHTGGYLAVVWTHAVNLALLYTGSNREIVMSKVQAGSLGLVVVDTQTPIPLWAFLLGLALAVPVGFGIQMVVTSIFRSSAGYLKHLAKLNEKRARRAERKKVMGQQLAKSGGDVAQALKVTKSVTSKKVFKAMAPGQVPTEKPAKPSQDQLKSAYEGMVLKVKGAGAGAAAGSKANSKVAAKYAAPAKHPQGRPHRGRAPSVTESEASSMASETQEESYDEEV